MDQLPISVSETDYIIKGVEANLRTDGRGNLDLREINLTTGVISQTYGSARGRIGSLGRGTEIIVGIKAEIGNWIPGEKENVGKIVCNVEISPIANQSFGTRTAEDLNVELTNIVSNCLDGPQSGLDLEQLCIIPKQAYWILYVDAMVLSYEGNIIDPLFYTIRAAFSDVRIPKVVVESVLDEDTKVEHLAYEIVDDPSAVTEIKGWQDIPLSVTFYKIGKKYVVDTIPEEENISTLRTTVCVNSSGEICLIHKGKYRGGMAYSLLSEALFEARKLVVDLIASQNKQLESCQSNKDGMEVPDTGSTFLNAF
ncbi:Exosome complex exonuclease RRP42 [Zancudomyces culisetae]|uniref:Ribosomal RNA-processing protein 42 n=1 Tax=Zancudomyces culisetae TaxID=1213189 RepID=A0A1R1PP03_ZANCU|nr:Exosome complex exonuclease RRP42 [Zancudomyces culisetae]OMH82697.1 Exosome complex exonuclease RRP42 [Zancudomyces culisetae]|eukprot:OMH78922.1 Exosome complex exonuclease RRP42 [Zancudomyces culisetae]